MNSLTDLCYKTGTYTFPAYTDNGAYQLSKYQLSKYEGKPLLHAKAEKVILEYKNEVLYVMDKVVSQHTALVKTVKFLFPDFNFQITSDNDL